MPRNAANDAKTTCQANQNDIARLMDVLQMELEKYAEPSATKGWGEAGVLGKVRSDLIDLVSFISQVDRPAIEDFLTEAD